MAEDLYNLTASGVTPNEVVRSLQRQQEDLTRKFRGRNVSEGVAVVEGHYTGRFTLQGRCNRAACTTAFTVQSDVGFDAVDEEAAERIGGRDLLTSYDKTYSAEQGLKLTAAQKRALKPRDTGAWGGEEREYSRILPPGGPFSGFQQGLGL